MRTIPVFLTLGLALALPAGARAGLYYPDDPGGMDASNFKNFRLRLMDLRALVVPPPSGKPESSAREAVLKQLAELRAKEKEKPLVGLGRVKLGACLIRLGKPGDAIVVLTPAAADREDPHQFLALSNLATAHQELGELNRAVLYLEEAMRVWPRVYAELPPATLTLYRRCDRLQLRLLRSREQEVRLGGRPAEGLDPIFPGVRFGGPGGYAPGEMTPESKDALPPDAPLLVAQLVYWLPFDNRLYWLLGEIFNASGNIQAAYDVMDELVYARRFPAQELHEHRKVLNEARKGFKELTDDDSRNVRRLFWVMAPRGVGLGGGVAAAMPDVGWESTLDPYEQAQQWKPPPIAPPPPKMPEWKTVMVSAVFGALVALLLRQQFRRGRPQEAPAAQGAHGAR